MMKCCGRDDVTTPYCPHCGKQLRRNDALGLLAYCKMHRDRAVERVAWCEKNVGNLGESRRAAARLAKWGGWTTALEGLLKETKE
jgi:hypothetical protein